MAEQSLGMRIDVDHPQTSRNRTLRAVVRFLAKRPASRDVSRWHKRFSGLRRQPVKPEVAGSSPVTPANLPARRRTISRVLAGLRRSGASPPRPLHPAALCEVVRGRGNRTARFWS